jgi:branched-subunit amino acid aminotransferase/4-amino-4-deoxychorismate lyase
VDSIEQRPVHIDELLAAREVFMTSTTCLVVPVTHVDETPIGDGSSGKTALALHAAMVNDMRPAEGSARHTAVPYGYLTGMRSQLV